MHLASVLYPAPILSFLTEHQFCSYATCVITEKLTSPSNWEKGSIWSEPVTLIYPLVKSLTKGWHKPTSRCHVRVNNNQCDSGYPSSVRLIRLMGKFSLHLSSPLPSLPPLHSPPLVITVEDSEDKANSQRAERWNWTEPEPSLCCIWRLSCTYTSCLVKSFLFFLSHLGQSESCVTCSQEHLLDASSRYNTWSVQKTLVYGSSTYSAQCWASSPPQRLPLGSSPSPLAPLPSPFRHINTNFPTAVFVLLTQQ